MKKHFYLIVLCLCCRICDAQNLIPNPGFENYTGCPANNFFFNNIQIWQNPTLGSPDYFKACALLVPDNWVTYQYANSGDSYVGLIIKNSGTNTVEWREYIQCPLTAPLVIGTKYLLSMYANISNNFSRFGSSSIAGLFTTFPYFQNDNFAIPLTPQAINDSAFFITDTLDWQLVQIPFTADSSYTYLTIGNFFPDSLTTYYYIQNAPDPRSYFLLDDISLIVDPSSGLNQNDSHSHEINIFPNPFFDKLNFESKENEQLELMLYDITSRKVFNQSFKNSISLNTAQFSKGIYIYELRSKNNVIQKGKVVKN